MRRVRVTLLLDLDNSVVEPDPAHWNWRSMMDLRPDEKVLVVCAERSPGPVIDWDAPSGPSKEQV